MLRFTSVHALGRDTAAVGIVVAAAAVIAAAVAVWLGALAGAAVGVAVVGALLAFGRGEPPAARPRGRAAGPVAGERVRVLELDGFVSVDAARRLLGEVQRGRMAGPLFLVLDLRAATGVARPAATVMARVQRLLGERGVTVVYTGLGPPVQRLLARAGCTFAGPGGRAADDLQGGLEWCEAQGEGHGRDAQLLARFQAATGDRWLLPQLLRRCEARALAAGAEVLRTGSGDDAVHFVEEGTLSVWQDLGDGDRLLLRSLGPGAVVRGAVLRAGADRPVMVVCDTPARVHRLSAATLRALEAEDPFLATGLERLLGGLDGEQKTPRVWARGPAGLAAALSSGRRRGAAATSGRGDRG